MSKPDGEVESVDLSDIKFDEHNANLGSERGRYMVEASLRQYGFADAGTLDKDNRIIGGNKRTEVAGEIGMDEAIIVDVDGTKPVFIRRKDLDLSDPEDTRARALAYALNRSSEVSLTWDAEVLLADLAAEVPLHDFFREDELDELLADIDKGPEPTVGADTPPETSRADELQKEWGTELGQLWQCGPHRVICGDCTDADVVGRLMGGGRVDLVFTDPPYGVSIGSKNKMLNSFGKAGGNLTEIEDDTLSPDDLKDRLLPAFINLRKNVCSDSCSVFMTAPQGGDLWMMMMMMSEAGLPIRHILIWKKNAPTFSMGRLDYDYQHEPILFTWTKRHKKVMQGAHKSSVWEIDKPRASADHPTMKPVELVENAMLNNSESGDNVADIYLGSGTTLIAAHNLNRVCYGTEISPAYVAVILQRFKDHSGIEPELVSS